MALGSRAVSDFLICSTYATGLRMTSLPPTSCKRTAATQISNHAIAFSKIATASARLAQPAERKALNLVVVGSSPTVGALHMWRATLGNEKELGNWRVCCAFTSAAFASPTLTRNHHEALRFAAALRCTQSSSRQPKGRSAG